MVNARDHLGPPDGNSDNGAHGVTVIWSGLRHLFRSTADANYLLTKYLFLFPRP